MPLTIQGATFSSAQELLEKCHQGSAEKVAFELKKTRYSYIDIPHKEKALGTFDATSCIGVIYQTAKTIYVQHLDSRPLHPFLTSGPILVTLIGGCKLGHHLERHTLENMETFIRFWKEQPLSIDIQGWAIGEGKHYDTLCSDFIVTKERIYLIKQGEIAHLNRQMNGTLIPQIPHRLAMTLIDSSRYFLVCQDSKTLELPGLKHIDRWKDYAHMLIELDDETLLKQCSTTPILEPPYFPQMMREMAAYLLEQNETVLPLKAPLLKDHPVFAMQGEIVSMVKKP